ncbi:MAG: response regulator [Candidatus Cloacimonetes bacterium]|nr:response regulator [Candidatus Cloacimonadota bacterium]
MDIIKVLIVEDERIIAESIKLSVEKLNYSVCGIEAWGEKVSIAIEEMQPDLVLMDIRLRGEMSGVQAAAIIKEKYSIPVVFLTSYSDDKTIQNAKQTYPYGYLVKPFEERELYATIEIALFKHRTAKELDQYRNRLEHLVDERTAELNKINFQLENRIKEEVEKRNKQQQVIVQQSKLASLGELAAGIAHEINQPLNIISFTMDNVLAHIETGSLNRDYLQKKMNKIFQNIFRMKNTIQHIQTFSREQKEGNCEMFDLNKPVNDAINLLSEQYRNHGINLRLELAPEILPVYGNPFRLEQVLLNLVSNARDAVIMSKGEIIVRTMLKNQQIIMEVSDNGEGIAPDIIDQVIHPFFTTKQPGEGTGLGLSISYGIVKDMDGNLEIESEKGKGTTAKVFLPISKMQENHNAK